MLEDASAPSEVESEAERVVSTDAEAASTSTSTPFVMDASTPAVMSVEKECPDSEVTPSVYEMVIPPLEVAPVGFHIPLARGVDCPAAVHRHTVSQKSQPAAQPEPPQSLQLVVPHVLVLQECWASWLTGSMRLPSPDPPPKQTSLQYEQPTAQPEPPQSLQLYEPHEPELHE